MLLWRSIAQYLAHNDKRYLFGCCSVSTQDPAVGWRLYHHLHQHGQVDTTCRVSPRAAYAMPLAPVVRSGAGVGESREAEAAGDEAVAVPPLMRLYLRYGGRVFGTPAIDRRFGTIDFLVLFDVATLSDDRFRTFFGAA
jgi:putative hemolysin